MVGSVGAPLAVLAPASASAVLPDPGAGCAPSWHQTQNHERTPIGRPRSRRPRGHSRFRAALLVSEFAWYHHAAPIGGRSQSPNAIASSAATGAIARATIHTSRFGLVDVTARDRYRPNPSAPVRRNSCLLAHSADGTRLALFVQWAGGTFSETLVGGHRKGSSAHRPPILHAPGRASLRREACSGPVRQTAVRIGRPPRVPALSGAITHVVSPVPVPTTACRRLRRVAQLRVDLLEVVVA